MIDKQAWNTSMLYLLEKCNIPKHWLKKSFNMLTGDKSYVEAVNQIKNWDFHEPSSLFLSSPNPGTGKTHLCVCLAKKFWYQFFLKNPDAVLQRNTFIKESELFNEIRDSYNDNSYITESKIIDKYVNSYFLVIDDLFCSVNSTNQKSMDFARRIILDIIDRRLDWHKRTTIISSNLSLQDISTIDPRISSRISAGLKFNFSSQYDHRIKRTAPKL